MNLSFWEKELLVEKFDVTILGAGITGISTAISLVEKNPGIRVCVVERSGFSLGASTKNAGFSCFGSPTEILKDIQKMGEGQTYDIIKMRWDGLQMLKKRVNLTQMKYNDCGGYEIFMKNDPNFDEVKEKLGWINTFVGDITKHENTYKTGRNSTLAAFHKEYIFNSLEGCLQPVLMMQQLHHTAQALGVKLISNANVSHIDQVNKDLVLDSGDLIPYHILCICTNGFTGRLLPEIKVVPARNQVLMTKPLSNIPFSGCYHFDKGYYYFRNYENRILLGGARNFDPESESTDQFGLTENIQQVLLQFLDKIYPGAHNHVDSWWSGILGVGEEKTPIVQWISDHIICGVRLGGMGVAIGSYLGENLANEILFRSGRKE
ncbi:MAG: FAD-binding oxidoreductase [Saprospiraceae bacterium]|nr:FAD-binding oxidoreductase [Saprospiraceae bacterium]MBK8370431.1 FAD-binding oxidoreductase [Saprospiraceae bacterium]MBK8546648.1 FAD-binding oxidoreductase [Saprospiraceae bacterium]MBK8817773.1 FAD-binding oxidoreductase [Saprospiraceae bacterium]MBP6695559.1 FAD-binding oxidoreductase [Saprospiraceae bacterium]